MFKKLFSGFEASTGFFIRHTGFSKAPARCCWQVLKWYLIVGLGRQPQMRIAAWRAVFKLPQVFRSPAKVFYVFGRDYEPEIHFLEIYLQPGDVFVDGGANFGLYTVLASHFVGENGRDFAFEPFPDSHRITEGNIQRNDLGNAAVYPIALSNKTAEATMGLHHDPGRNSLSLQASETVSTLVINTVRMDEFWLENNLPPPTVMKLDVEGHEYFILQGAEKILREACPTIIFEVNPPACLRAGCPADAIAIFLGGIGYQFFAFASEGLVPAEPTGGDYVAIHSSKLTDVRNQSKMAHSVS